MSKFNAGSEYGFDLEIEYEVTEIEERYGADADGNRGVTRTVTEVDYTAITVNGLELKTFPSAFRMDIVELVDKHFGGVT